MKKYFVVIVCCLSLLFKLTNAQQVKQSLNNSWQFRQLGTLKWYTAKVPGTVHTDLLANKLIPDPFYRDNEKKLQWVDRENWEYRTTFLVNSKLGNRKNCELVFDGLDTYAEVFLNGKLVLSANNMFRQWRVNIKKLLKPENHLLIRFLSAKNRVDSLAKAALPVVLPDNPRVYVRKAQYHFGWDWGPVFITSGIWKNVYLQAFDEPVTEKQIVSTRKVELVQESDSIGKSFYFKIDGKPVYMKGANYIPADVFLTRTKKNDYRKIVLAAKAANMNMLRVWGGGIYENDEFYDLCDQYGIFIWQDFMFAGGMVPADEAFFDNVREEIKYQVNRIKHHSCIVLWCGNNEVEEAWHNWDWQQTFNLHGTDSVKIWDAYKRLFQDSIPVWVTRYDGTRPYISTSPLNSQADRQSLLQGDFHYWGVWWGLEDIETYGKNIPRFLSEYGMQAMPNYTTTLEYTSPRDRWLFSDVLKIHQKHPVGYQTIQNYLHRYMLDSNKVKQLSLENYTYLTQCFQYYCLKNAIAMQRSAYPENMGTLVWQLNDCWPVCSWSITDYSRQPKAAWYAVKEAYKDDKQPEKDTVRPVNLCLQKPFFTIKFKGKNKFIISSTRDAKYVFLYNKFFFLNLSDNYFDLKAGEKKYISLQNNNLHSAAQIKIKSLYDISGN